MKEIEINADVLKQIFDTCKPALSKDDTRPILKHIYVEVEENKLTATSLDGYMVVSYTTKIDYTGEPFTFFTQPFVMPKDKVGCIVRINCDDDKLIKYTFIGMSNVQKQEIAFSRVQGEYINYRNVFDGNTPNDDLTIYMSARRLSDFAKCFATTNFDNNSMVKIQFNKKDGRIDAIKPMLFEQYNAYNPEEKKRGILLPIRHE